MLSPVNKTDTEESVVYDTDRPVVKDIVDSNTDTASTLDAKMQQRRAALLELIPPGIVPEERLNAAVTAGDYEHIITDYELGEVFSPGHLMNTSDEQMNNLAQGVFGEQEQVLDERRIMGLLEASTDDEVTAIRKYWAARSLKQFPPRKKDPNESDEDYNAAMTQLYEDRRRYTALGSLQNLELRTRNRKGRNQSIDEDSEKHVEASDASTKEASPLNQGDILAKNITRTINESGANVESSRVLEWLEKNYGKRAGYTQGEIISAIRSLTNKKNGVDNSLITVIPERQQFNPDETLQLKQPQKAIIAGILNQDDVSDEDARLYLQLLRQKYKDPSIPLDRVLWAVSNTTDRNDTVKSFTDLKKQNDLENDPFEGMADFGLYNQRGDNLLQRIDVESEGMATEDISRFVEIGNRRRRNEDLTEEDVVFLEGLPRLNIPRPPVDEPVIQVVSRSPLKASEETEEGAGLDKTTRFRLAKLAKDYSVMPDDEFQNFVLEYLGNNGEPLESLVGIPEGRLRSAAEVFNQKRAEERNKKAERNLKTRFAMQRGLIEQTTEGRKRPTELGRGVLQIANKIHRERTGDPTANLDSLDTDSFENLLIESTQIHERQLRGEDYVPLEYTIELNEALKPFTGLDYNELDFTSRETLIESIQSLITNHLEIFDTEELQNYYDQILSANTMEDVVVIAIENLGEDDSNMPYRQGTLGSRMRSIGAQRRIEESDRRQVEENINRRREFNDYLYTNLSDRERERVLGYIIQNNQNIEDLSVDDLRNLENTLALMEDDQREVYRRAYIDDQIGDDEALINALLELQQGLNNEPIDIYDLNIDQRNALLLEAEVLSFGEATEVAQTVNEAGRLRLMRGIYQGTTQAVRDRVSVEVDPSTTDPNTLEEMIREEEERLVLERRIHAVEVLDNDEEIKILARTMKRRGRTEIDYTDEEYEQLINEAERIYAAKQRINNLPQNVRNKLRESTQDLDTINEERLNDLINDAELAVQLEQEMSSYGRRKERESQVRVEMAQSKRPRQNLDSVENARIVGQIPPASPAPDNPPRDFEESMIEEFELNNQTINLARGIVKDYLATVRLDTERDLEEDELTVGRQMMDLINDNPELQLMLDNSINLYFQDPNRSKSITSQRQLNSVLRSLYSNILVNIAAYADATDVVPTKRRDDGPRNGGQIIAEALQKIKDLSDAEISDAVSEFIANGSPNPQSYTKRVS